MYRDVGGIVVVSSILFVAKSDSVPKGLEKLVQLTKQSCFSRSRDIFWTGFGDFLILEVEGCRGRR